MTKRIFRSILIVAISVLLLCFLVIMGVLYDVFSAEQRDQLKAELDIAAYGTETGGEAWLKGLRADGYRLTLISPDGVVIYDSTADAASMENHLDREEVQQALASGAGESERTSATLVRKTLYQALRLSDGNVLRISITGNSVLTLLMGMLTPVIIVLAAAVILAAVLAQRISRRAVAPLNALDLEHPLDNDVYDELSPLLVRIAHQQRQIDTQIDELKRKQDELAAITGSMNEGLVLLNDMGMIVSMNPAARRLFNVDEACSGQDIMTVERSGEMRRMLSEAAANGRAETTILRGGRRYQLDASRILSNGQAIGTAILTFDVTDRMLAERQRREFTANVSHELKTPLQSIMGSAELMENGLVKPEDMPRFTGHIRTEAARLVTLIEDIIRLSRLDEGDELPFEDVELMDIANEAVTALQNAAEAKGVQLSLSGDGATVRGVRGLIYEIIYNLCDNAIKYNVQGGRVDVSVSRDANRAVLSVSDTGIGIPEEHQGRIFERFYRVDKSHSKSTGGTGLGLSIVKHAVQAHNGKTELKSSPGKGTTVTITLPV